MKNPKNMRKTQKRVNGEESSIDMVALEPQSCSRSS